MKRVSLWMVSFFLVFSSIFISVVFGITGQDVLDEIQKRYENTKDFEANFQQEYIGKVMKQPIRGEGKVYFKKKGMTRWDYQSPNQKLISNGLTFWQYQPEEKQVFVSDVGRMIKEFGFLVGEGDLRRDFKLLKLNESSSQKGNVVIEIIPNEPQPAVSKLSLTVDKRTYDMVQVDVFDGLGNVTRTRFIGIKTNVGLSDSFFNFTIPAGVEIFKIQTPAPG